MGSDAGFSDLYGGAAGMSYSHETNTFRGNALPLDANLLTPALTIQEAMRRSRQRYDEPGLDTVKPDDLHWCEGVWIEIQHCRVGHRAFQGTA